MPSPALDWLGTGGGPAWAPRTPPSPSTDQSEEQRDLTMHRKLRPSPGPATRSSGRIGEAPAPAAAQRNNPSLFSPGPAPRLQPRKVDGIRAEVAGTPAGSRRGASGLLNYPSREASRRRAAALRRRAPGVRDDVTGSRTLLW